MPISLPHHAGGSRLRWEIDRLRVEASTTLDARQRAEFGQDFTPWVLASFMATFFERFTPLTRLLDAGAGIGSLTGAVVAEAVRRADRPSRIDVAAYDMDPKLLASLSQGLALCQRESVRHTVQFSSRGIPGDFLSTAVAMVEDRDFRGRAPKFTHAVPTESWDRSREGGRSHSSTQRTSRQGW